ncbi:MAG: low molecular weight phosphotyrosine protein phosphatase, partial [Gammaproteobacteria bacterium]
MSQKILMVCLGNICRSPLAEGILRHRLDAMGRDDVLVDSAGTSAYHVGEPPDPRSMAVAERHGIDIRGLRARQLTAEDGNQFDWILVMDDQNLASA